MKTACAAFVAALAIGAADRAFAIEVQCGSEGGDAFGWAIASGADFNGDGTTDIAISAPCAWVASSIRAGRVKIFSGDDHRVLRSLVGNEPEQELGAAIDFLPDIDGDGRAELVVGSPNSPAPKPGGGTFLFAGKVEVYSSRGGVIWTARGTSANATFGESLEVVPDVNGDGKDEVSVGASGALVAGLPKGSGYLLSGASGSQIARTDGEEEGDLWGSLVGHAGDVDGDGTADWLSASRISGTAPEGEILGAESTTTTSTTTTTLPPRAGRLTVLSGESPYEEIRTYYGDELVDRLGRSAAPAGDVDGDSLGDLWIGAPGAEPNLEDDAGEVGIYSATGVKIGEITEPTPQQLAAFGTSVVVPGQLDGTGHLDVVAGAPNARVSGRNQAGRVHAYSLDQDEILWTQSGTLAQARFGQSLESGLDYDGDGVRDVVVGAPGNSPAGKRGAGSAFVLSGETGEQLAEFHGRRGRETRIFVAGPGITREPVVRSLDSDGRRREALIRPLRGQTATRLSLSLLNAGRREETNNGAATLLAIGSGIGGSNEIEVYRANRRKRRVSSFTAGPAAYTGGLHVAGGDFSTEAGHEMAVLPAEAAGPDVVVSIYRPEFVDPSTGRIDWSFVREFKAFVAGETIAGQQVNAVGGNVAAGDVHPNDQDEIVVGPVSGRPVVKVFGKGGLLLGSWQAFPFPGSGSQPNTGVSIAVGNLDGEGRPEIVVTPVSGQPWFRAWRWDTEESKFAPYQYAPNLETSFTIDDFGLAYSGGLTVATADVDLDGDAEILLAPNGNVPARVVAYEDDGTPVAGWVPVEPFGPLAKGGIGLAGLDHLWRP